MAASQGTEFQQHGKALGIILEIILEIVQGIIRGILQEITQIKDPGTYQGTIQHQTQIILPETIQVIIPEIIQEVMVQGDNSSNGSGNNSD